MPRPVALISGASRSAGIAKKLAADGWDLALSYWLPYDARMPWGQHPDDVSALERDLITLGARIALLPADLEQPAAAAYLLAAANSALGPMSALVLAHCESVNADILTTSIESFDRHFAVNARASWLLIREFALQIPTTGGRIVALTSDSLEDNLAYGASKAALNRIVLAAARELAPRGILANVVNPGPIDNGWMDDAMRAAVLARQPTGRIGTPRDVADLIAFLLSPAGAWINGQLIKSDGGFSA